MPATQKAGKKRKAPALKEVDDGEDFFLVSDEEDAAGRAEEEEERAETAEEKRLRLAKEVLGRLRDEHEDDDEIEEKLQHDALEASGRLQRRIACRVRVPDLRPEQPCARYGAGGRLLKGHRLPVTALALTADDAVVFSVSKEGAILQWDVEAEKGQRLRLLEEAVGEQGRAHRADWVAQGPRAAGRRALFAAAVSSDNRYLAVGGGDSKVHVWDVRSSQYIQGFLGHKDVVTGLAFLEGSSTLYSCSFDRTVKMWSLQDRAYIDTLFGNQAQVHGLHCLRQERVLCCGADRTCRLFKVPEDSQLVFRAHTQSTDSCCLINSTEWITGHEDGSVAVWSQTRKKPSFVQSAAHWDPSAPPPGCQPLGPGAVGGDACRWVQSVSCCASSDLAASGAGDGLIRLWQLLPAQPRRKLKPIGVLPARGFVNAIRVASSGRFVVAAVGQEPRLGRWARDAGARNGVLLHRLQLESEDEEGEE